MLSECRVATFESGTDDMDWSSRKHQTLQEAKQWIGKRESFGFIRNPLSLLKSYWTFRQLQKWTDQDIDKLPERDDLNLWLTNVAMSYPGWVGREYLRVLGGCTHIGRTEDLPVSLITILRRCEPSITASAVLAIGKSVNTNATNSLSMYVRPDVVSLVMKSEEKANDMWERSVVRGCFS